MNTIRSFWLGWGSLCVAGAGAYVFAKRQINADRQSKLEDIRKRKKQTQAIESLEYSENVPNRPLSSATMGGTVEYGGGGGGGGGGGAGEGNKDASLSSSSQKSKYEPAKQFISPKGNRF